jgi:multiple sugar transport system substrate-binding protein
MTTRRRFLWLAAAATIPLASALVVTPAAYGAKQSVTFTVMNSGTYNVAADALAKSFEAKTGIQVNVLAFPYATLEQKNVEDLISGRGQFDVISGSYYLAPVYPYMENLSSFIKTWPERTKLVNGLLANSEVYNGYPIGIPYAPDAYGMVYNTKYFQEAGIASFPTTWPAFFKDLAILKAKLGKKGIAPFVFAGGDLSQAPAILFATYTGTFINSAGHYQLQTAAAVRSLNMAKTMLSYGPQGITGLSIDQANTVFLSGKAAILYGWPSFIDASAYNPQDSKVIGEWKVAPDPQPGFTWLSLWQLYMAKTTADKSAAWKWMEAFTAPSNDVTNFETYGIDPMYAATYHSSAMLKKYGNYFDGEEVNLSHAKNPPLTGQSQNYLSAVLQTVYDGSSTPAAAVAKINAAWASMPVPKVLIQEAARHGLGK